PRRADQGRHQPGDARARDRARAEGSSGERHRARRHRHAPSRRGVARGLERALADEAARHGRGDRRSRALSRRCRVHEWRRPADRRRRGGGALVSAMTSLRTRFLMRLQVVVPPPLKLGAVPHGARVVAPIASGTFEGPRLRGKVLPGGADWTLLRSDGVLELDLRLTLETDDGASIYMTSSGLRHGPPEVLAALGRGEAVDPSRYYFRTAVRFETSAPQHAYLNRSIAISSGDRRATGPIYTI